MPQTLPATSDPTYVRVSELWSPDQQKWITDPIGRVVRANHDAGELTACFPGIGVRTVAECECAYDFLAPIGTLDEADAYARRTGWLT